MCGLTVLGARHVPQTTDAIVPLSATRATARLLEVAAEPPVEVGLPGTGPRRRDERRHGLEQFLRDDVLRIVQRVRNGHPDLDLPGRLVVGAVDLEIYRRSRQGRRHRRGAVGARASAEWNER